MQADDAMFWDRLAEMPHIEAEHECVLRREELCLQLAVLRTEMNELIKRGHTKTVSLREVTAAQSEVQAQLTKLNERIKELRKLQSRIDWRAAVATLYGEEAVVECLVWMEQTGCASIEATKR